LCRIPQTRSTPFLKKKVNKKGMSLH
jgi:hypothetical protein